MARDALIERLAGLNQPLERLRSAAESVEVPRLRLMMGTSVRSSEFRRHAERWDHARHVVDAVPRAEVRRGLEKLRNMSTLKFITTEVRGVFRMLVQG